MANNNLQMLSENDKIKLIEKLEKKIREFQKYDEERKKYYKNSIERLGELESFVEELKENDGAYKTINKLKEKIERQRRSLNSLEAKIRILKASSDMENIKNMDEDEILNLVSLEDAKKQIKLLKKETKRQKEIISGLVYKINNKKED